MLSTAAPLLEAHGRKTTCQRCIASGDRASALEECPQTSPDLLRWAVRLQACRLSPDQVSHSWLAAVREQTTWLGFQIAIRTSAALDVLTKVLVPGRTVKTSRNTP
jgi:hypothetical protein